MASDSRLTVEMGQEMNRIKSIQWCVCAIFALFVSMGSNEARAYDSVEQNCNAGDAWKDSKCVYWNNNYYPRECVQYRVNPVSGLSDVPFWVATNHMYGVAWVGQTNLVYRSTSSLERARLENEETRYSECWRWKPDYGSPANYGNEEMMRDIVDVGTTTSVKGFELFYDVNCVNIGTNLKLADDDRSGEWPMTVEYPNAYSPSRCYVRGDKVVIDMAKIGGRDAALEESYSRDGFTVKSVYIPDVSKVMTEEGITREIKNSAGTTFLTMSMPWEGSGSWAKIGKSVNGSLEYGLDGSKKGHRLFSLVSIHGNRYRAKPIIITGTPEVWNPEAVQEWLTETGEDPAYGVWFYPGSVWEGLAVEKDINSAEQVIEIGPGETFVFGMDMDTWSDRGQFLVEVLDELDNVVASHLVKQGATPAIGVITINNGN